MKKTSTQKTNAMRELEKAGIAYNIHSYDTHGEVFSGVVAAEHLQVPTELVYKTLVTQGRKGELYVFVIPAASELDLKKAAKAVGEKNVELIAVKDLYKKTGYVRGGCSPLAMKKKLPTVIDISAQDLSSFLVSAGQLGVSVEVDPVKLAAHLSAPFANLLMEHTS